MSFEPKDRVKDIFRVEAYGGRVGFVVEPMGPYRTLVQWPDTRGKQIEQNVHLEKVDS
jgi:hypothetical protein